MNTANFSVGISEEHKVLARVKKNVTDHKRVNTESTSRIPCGQKKQSLNKSVLFEERKDDFIEKTYYATLTIN